MRELQNQTDHDIKPFPKQTDSICWTCLSSDRRVVKLGHFMDLYSHIMQFNNLDVVQDNVWLEAMRLCWECAALLRRVSQFHARALRASEMLDTAIRYGMSLKFDSLSVIKTIKNENIIDIEFDELEFELKSENEDYKQTLSPEIDFPFSDREELEQDLTDEKDKSIYFDFDSLNMKPELNDNLITDELLKLEPGPSKLSEDVLKPKITKQKLEKTFKRRKSSNKFKKVKLSLSAEYAGNKDLIERKKLSHKEMVAYREEVRVSKEFRENPFKCETCILGFDYKYTLLRHFKLYHDESGYKYTCNICQSGFKKKKPDLSNHMKTHYVLMTCKLCGYTCNRSIRGFYNHVNNHKNTSGLQCHKCKLIFNTYNESMRHYRLHTVFECDLCGKIYKKKSLLEKHIILKHDFDRPRKCKQCNRTYGNTKKLLSHIRTHKQAPKELRYCVECDRTFVTIYYYNNHCILQHGPKLAKQPKEKHPCPLCNKMYVSQLNVKNHIKLEHEKETDFYCSAHDKYFSTKSALQQHIKTVHKRDMPPKNKVCPHCGHGFRGKTALENHIRTHTGERPYKCPHCNSAFAQRTPLVSHVKRIHMMEPPPPPKRNNMDDMNLQ